MNSFLSTILSGSNYEIKLCFRLTKNRPNTYVFTKALAENILLKQSTNLPIAIIRPSIGNVGIIQSLEIRVYYLFLS